MTGTRQELPQTPVSSFYMKKSTLGCGLDILERTQFYPAEQFSSNIYTGYWMLYIYDLKIPDTLFCRQGTGPWRPVDAHTRMGLYVPPYQLVEWKIAAGQQQWTSYYCDAPPPPRLLKHPFLFPIYDHTLPTCYDTLVDLISNAQAIIPLSEKAQDQQHPALLKLISTIQLNYKEQVSIHDLIKDTSVPTSTAHYIFQKNMNLTPIQYRNKLRMFEALRLIGNNMMSVTEACYASGFNDYSRFYTHFTDELKISPRAFTRFTSYITITQEQAA